MMVLFLGGVCVGGGSFTVRCLGAQLVWELLTLNGGFLGHQGSLIVLPWSRPGPAYGECSPGSSDLKKRLVGGEDWPPMRLPDFLSGFANIVGGKKWR